MSYRLTLTDDPQSALHRTATERLTHAIEQLEERAADDADKAVHKARKDVKKTRALLRLHRSAMARDRFKTTNRALRDAGRELSDLRDARVMVDTVDALAERFAGQLPADAFAGVRKRLEPAAGTSAGDDAIEDARARLSAIAADVSQWDLDDDAARAVVDDLRRTYARGRDAAAKAARQPTAEHFHEWRKRAKDLRHQQELLRDAFPGVVDAQADAAKELADLLGDDHDLAVLSETAGGLPEFGEIAELVPRRRKELQAQALLLGSRVYAESPKRFAKRVAHYIDLARRGDPAGAAT